MTIRARVYWALDRARGGAVTREIEQVSSLAEQRSHELSDALLQVQIEHVVQNVPYYRGLKGTYDLSDFPIVDKATIRAAGDRTIATGTDVSACSIASTSGSTGMPFRVLHEPAKRRRVLADAIFWGEQAGYQLGAPLLHMKVWSDRNRIGLFPRTLRNIIPIDTTSLDGNDLLAIVDSVSRRRPVSIISYASSLALLAQAIEVAVTSGRDPENLPQIRSIIGQSEHLPSDARDTLRRHLSIDPVSRYGLEELGIVGQQVPGGGSEFLINSPSLIVEILALDSTEPAGPGQTGRIVVTELINRAQPLIRYDTGDLGRFRVDEYGQIDPSVLSAVEGRRLDQIYDVNDHPLTSMVMYNLWWRFPDIMQYQLVQRGRGDYLLRINVGAGFNRADEVVRRFKEIVGKTATVDLEITSEEFVLSSGKRKSVVSHYSPKGAV